MNITVKSLKTMRGTDGHMVNAVITIDGCPIDIIDGGFGGGLEYHYHTGARRMPTDAERDQLAKALATLKVAATAKVRAEAKSPEDAESTLYGSVY